MRSRLWLLILLVPFSATAYDIDFAPAGVQSDFRAVSEDMGGAFSYKPLDPAEAAGIEGFRIGLLGSYTDVANTQSWQNLTGQKVQELGFVALAASKGLIGGLDASGFYAEVPDSNAGLYGLALKWAFIDGSVATPAVAVRLAHTELTGVDDVAFDTQSLDLSISKGFPGITPYIGVGQVRVNSDPKNTIGLSKESFDDTKLYGGVEFSLALFKLLLEADATGDTTSFGLKVGLGL